MKNNIGTDIWLSRIGMGLIFCYCLLASIFFSYFAQIHVSLDFLPFPIFVGEILMLICVLLLAGIHQDGQSFNRRTMLLLGLYFGWVVVKALINYYYDGPLTCRNAALFYYPVFAVFAYVFYQKARVPRKVLMSLAFLATGILFFKVMSVWYWWTYVTLLVIAVCNIISVKWRRIAWILLAAIILLGKEYLYNGSRAHFVSIFFSVVFLIFYFGALLVKRHDFVRLSALLTAFLFFILGYLIFANKNDVSSLISLKGMIKTYKSFDSQFQERKVVYVPAKIPVQLYHPKEFTSPFSAVHSWTDVTQSRVVEGRTLELDQTNIVFRLFVWRDMVRELIQKRAWWGFSFGHPQRSRSLEVLSWASGEWSRDGWITPHNSFLHVIYRAGILGIFLIGVLFFMIGRMVRDFFNLNSIIGGFLVAALVYWLVMSNFFVILEFPYNAILFWTLFGITWSYRETLQAKA